MPEPAARRMTASEFIDWAMQQPEGHRYELVAGEIVAMSPERSVHALTKAHVWRALDAAIEAAGLRCTAYPDGMTVEVDRDTVYEPDALVRCGEPVPDNAVAIDDPIIIIEVLSPTSRTRDAGAKLEDYFRLASVRHYLIVSTVRRSVIHHERVGSGEIRTRILHDGELLLDPPGLTLRIADCFV
jgi:Uma2 family endonuclease